MGVTARLWPVEQTGKDQRVPEPCTFTVFGASRDVTKRELLPALFHLRQAGLLPEEFAVVAVARRDLSETIVPDTFWAESTPQVNSNNMMPKD